MKSSKKFLSLILSGVITISSAVSVFASDAQAQQNVIYINDQAITEKDLEKYLSQITPEEALVSPISDGDENRISPMAAPAVVGIYLIPGVGEVALLATGAVVLAGITWEVGSWVVEKVSNWLAASAEEAAENALKEIPKKLKKAGSDDTVDLGKFKDKNGRTPNDKSSGEFKSQEDGRFTIEKDTAGHTGYDGSTKVWKLFKSGKRIASLNKSGKVVGK